ncbi:MAG: aminotransferase [Alphaproteobacteria bacterium]
MRETNPVYSGVATTVFEVMTRLAIRHDAINLGQGFPDVDGPADVLETAARALLEGPNQYPPMLGLPPLRRAVAAAAERFHGLQVDWQREVLVTSGATEALSDCIMAIVQPGDEVVLFEPLYDCYLPLVRRAGARPRLVRLSPPAWTVDPDELAAAFGPRTKAILINDPLNPAAKVFTEAERALIAELVVRHDAYAICDEVYEHILFDGRRHRPLMAEEGMRERCLRIGSAGKTLSLTGWKVGYVTAVAALLEPVIKAHQFTTFTTPPNLQHAVAYGLAKDDAYYAGLSGDLQDKRDRFARALQEMGFAVAPCQGTYFINADISRLAVDLDDVAFCKRMTVEAKVTAVPLSAFYHQNPPRQAIRFCFSKKDAVLDEAVARMARWTKSAFGGLS